MDKAVRRNKLKYIAAIIATAILILATTFWIGSEDGALSKINVDGVCVENRIPLYKASNELTLDQLKEKLDIDNKEISPEFYKEFQKLSDEYSVGDQLFKLTTSDSSWDRLYGSMGYGIVRNDCVVNYLKTVVS